MPLQIRRAAVSRLKFTVLTVGDLCNFRYRRALTAHPIDVYTDLFFIRNIKRSERKRFSDRFCLYENSEYYSTSIIVPPPTTVSPSYSTSA